MKLTSSDLPFRIVDVLDAKVKTAKLKSKRAYTRALLRLAAARELERVGYERLTVNGIISEAGVAHGTFYLYFKNSVSIASSVFRLYMAAVLMYRPRSNEAQTPFQSIFNINRYYVASYSANAKLLSARGLLLQADPRLATLKDRINARWAARVLRNLGSNVRFPGRHEKSDLTLLLIRSAIAMVDELLYTTYGEPSKSLSCYQQAPLEIALVLSVVWHRTIFGRDPPSQEVDEVLTAIGK